MRGIVLLAAFSVLCGCAQNTARSPGTSATTYSTAGASASGGMPIGVTHAGTTAVDVHFRQFGGYLQEVVNAVQKRWERILDASSTLPPSSSHVTVTFRMDSKGNISEIVKVDGDAGDFGAYAALNAIRDPAPYRPWTKEMIAALGNDQVITFSFYYH